MKSYNRYWGKIDKDSKRYHLLPYHCLDVAAVAWLLLDPEKPLCQRLASQLKIAPEHLQRWVAFILSLHDIGKFAVVFQGLVPGLSCDLVTSNARKKYTERHDSLGYCLWYDEGGLRDRLEAENIWLAQGSNTRQLRWTLDVWMQIVTGHHGIPPKTSGLYLSNNFDSQDIEAAWLYLLDVSSMFITADIVDVLADKEFCKRLKDASWLLA